MSAPGADVGHWIRFALFRDMAKRPMREDERERGIGLLERSRGVLHVPLEQAALCLNCEAVFRLVELCPACSSEAVAPLARWVQRAR